MIAICTPIRDRVNPAFMRSMIEADLPRPFATLDLCGHAIYDARNALTADALRDPAITHLMWIDDDAVFPSDAVKRLLKHGLPIVGGLCFGRRPPYAPILLYADADPKIRYRYRYDYPEGLVEVDATGAHFLLTERSVFETISKKFPAEGWWSQRGCGEDVSFCQRARDCGYRVMVDTMIAIGHVGEVVVDAAFAKRNRDVEINAWGK